MGEINYCADCERSIYGKYKDCDINIENAGECVLPDQKCYCKILADGTRAEKYPWDEQKND